MQYEPKKEVGRTVDDIIYLYCLHYYMLCYFAAGVHLTATNLTRQSYIADSAPGVATQTRRDTHRHAYHNISLSYRGWITSGQIILTKGTPPLKNAPFLCVILVHLGCSAAEWLACWTQAQKARVQIAVATLSGNSLRQTVHTHCTSIHQAAKLVAAFLRVARVTAGLAESNGSLPLGL